MKPTPATLSAPDNFLQPLRTLVVDDSVVLLRGLCAYLKTLPLFQVIGTAADGSEALLMAELHDPDLILMDLNMPVMDGLEATAILRRRQPNLRIVIMTLDDSAATAAQARAQGAHGFIGKLQILGDQLRTEIHRAFHAGAVNTPD